MIDWEEYERKKSLIPANFTPEQYEEEIKEILKEVELGKELL